MSISYHSCSYAQSIAKGLMLCVMNAEQIIELRNKHGQHR